MSANFRPERIEIPGQTPVYGLHQSSSDVPDGDDWLGPSERAVLAGLRFPKRREEWLLGRWTAKRLLLGCRECFPVALAQARELAGVEVRAAQDGAPEPFVSAAHVPLSLSITHRAGHAVCVLAGEQMAVGCDLELVEPRSSAFVRDYFSDAEQGWLASVGASQRDLATTLIWSAKEGALKAERVGLRRDTRTVEVLPVALSCGDQWQPLHVRAPHALVGRWRRLEGGHVLVVVVCPKTDLTLPR